MYSPFAAHLSAPDTEEVALEEAPSVVSGDYSETYEAAGVFLVICVLIAGLWHAVSKVAKPRWTLTLQQQVRIAKVMEVLIFTAVCSAAWDLWWHRAVGRDTLWELPHLLLYTTVLLAVVGSLLGWYVTRQRSWKYFAMALMLIPIAAPFDQLWHTIFGVEDFSKPHLLIWSPPHFMVSFSAVLSQFFLLPILRKEQDHDTRNLFGTLVFGCCTATMMFQMLPLHPTEGFGQILGFWGVFSLTAVISTVPLFGRNWLNDRVGASKICFVALAVLMVAYGEETAAGIVMTPHDRMPNWIIVATMLATGVAIDVSKNVPASLRGSTIGVAAALLMFGSTRFFTDPSLMYSLSDVAIAMLSGGLGGFVGMVSAKRYLRNNVAEVEKAPSFQEICTTFFHRVKLLFY